VVPQMALSEHMTGRVLDALGRPLDGLAPLRIGGVWHAAPLGSSPGQ